MANRGQGSRQAMRSRAVLLPLLGGLLFSTACTVGPNYQKPRVAVPPAYRSAVPLPKPAAKLAGGAIPLGQQKWWQVFHDPSLQALIRTALRQNYNLRIAAARIVEAQAQLGITRSNSYPAVAAQAGAEAERQPHSKFFKPYNYSQNKLGFGFAWDLDFWGKYRRETEAARADLLSTEWARREVASTLVASVASAWFQLRALDLELTIARRTLVSRRNSLHLTEVLAQHGATSDLDVRQAQQLVYQAAESIPDLQRRIEQQENLIRLLAGENPGPVARGARLSRLQTLPVAPAGLPSSLLNRRPDIQAAEQQLIAANANIGVARAAYFPDISLTAAGGFATSSLSGLFSSGAALWNVAGTLTQPLYTGGALKNNVRLARARRQQALLVYRQTVQQAFHDVSDQLIALQRDRQFLVQQQKLTRAAQEAENLSNLRYQGGVTSYLEVLDSDTRYFSAQLTLVQSRLNEQLDLVGLYRALGGGWQQ